jgi:hypothetical protein
VTPAVLADLGDFEVAYRTQPRRKVIHGT